MTDVTPTDIDRRLRGPVRVVGAGLLGASIGLALREKGVELNITEQDREDLKNTVDFVSFSYYMSTCATGDPARGERGEGAEILVFDLPRLQ